MIVRGQKINGRYEIIRNIGEGGMANVYLALDTILDRKVAVKVLRGDLATDEKFVRKFQREAQAASILDHPNIVGIYDVGEDDGNYFIVMEYVEGQTLKSLIKKRGSLTLAEVIDIMTQLTSGISHAHSKGIIHRDIKPQNILILDDGLVKIADFGIAHALNSNELTETNSVMGSVHYLPPEQANGTGSTFKSDIYSLGILMFELLIGKVPFKGENAVEIAIKQMKDPIPSVCDIKEEIPQSVENIILKATAKNPKNRYDSVEEMKYDIKTCLDDDKLNVSKIAFSYPEFETDEEISTVKSRTRRNESLSVEENNNEEETIEEKKSNNKLTIILAVLIGLLVIVFGILFILSKKNNTKSIEIPDVSKFTEKDASNRLEDLGLNVKTEESYSDEIEKGKVIKTSPRAGKNIKKGADITIYVSSGSEGIEVINYVGKDIDMVKSDLTSKGIKVELKEEEHSKDDVDIKENIIIAQDIEVGKKLVPGEKIVFTVPKLIVTYPDFVNEVYTYEEVEKFCKENGITLVKKEKESSTEKSGSIIYQSREAGTKVVKGASLTITVSKAPEVVAVTNITLNKTAVTLEVNGTVGLSATVSPSNASNQKITWSTSNSKVATVSNGTVTAIGAGTATITATADGSNVKATATITVNAPTQKTDTTTETTTEKVG